MNGLHASLVITGGHIITVNPRDDVAEAVAVFGDKIVAVGRADEIAPLIGDATEVIQLNGKTVLPGFIEPHTHFMMYGIWSNWVNAKTPPNKNISQLLKRIERKVAETPKGAWILGYGLEEGAFEEKRWPTREELDRVAPDNPLYIRHRSGHASIANSRALALAGITELTAQPEGGHIDRDPDTGRLTGVLREKAAFNKVQNLIPLPTKEQMKEGIIEAGRLYAKAGITSTHDAGADTRPDTYRAYQEAIDEGRLKIRVYLMIRDRPYDHYYLKRDLGLRTGYGNDRLRLGPVKTCTDGSIQVFTCAFYDPYITLDSESTRRNPRGVLQMSPNEINDIVLEAHRKGYQVAIHAQGDYGIDVAIDAIQYALWKHPRADSRHRIEHCQCVTSEGLKRMQRLGIIGSFYPHHTWYWADRHISTFIGMERASRIDPMKSAINAGVVTIAHSDAPIAGIGDPIFGADPLFGIWCAVNRKTRNGLLLGAEERITPMEGIRAYTINAAYASFEENIKGSIEPGKLADFVILSENPCAVDPWEIRNIRVERTIIGGETVYSSE
ncbi:MAG: amidohydrolase [Deltaproteobacteria bacterium]|nr:amidohydrolase [Deltaproteobacteria bacterium]MBW2153801.1 amidohydrolase [Deltaproteobacteria bacterium]